MSAVDRRGNVVATGRPDLDDLIESLNDLDDQDYGLVVNALIGMTVGKRLASLEERLAKVECAVREAGL